MLQNLKNHLINIPGWRTNRKIVVIESDDWGSIRMPNKTVYYKCLQAGYPLDKIAYEKYDTLASEQDLDALFSTFNLFKDIHGNPLKMTANIIVGNPNFEKIIESGYQEYFWEPFYDTLEKYGTAYQSSFSLWKEGIKNKLFHPQYHGREHVNVSLLMQQLRSGNTDQRFAIDNSLPGIMSKDNVRKGNPYVEATRYLGLQDKDEKFIFFQEGYHIFRQIFGFASKSIIPTNYQWSTDWDEASARLGILYFQGLRKRKSLESGKAGVKADRWQNLYMGKKNQFDQYFLVRNTIFEPSLWRLNIGDPVNYSFHQIQAAFRMKKPAIICSHRLNFIGALDESNRKNNLQLLKRLMNKVMDKYPEIEFMSSDELGGVIANN